MKELPRKTFLKQLSLGAMGLGLSSAFPVRLMANGAPASSRLPRSTPETQGVSSDGISRFLAAWAGYRVSESHSFMMVRHGHVVAESWWAPYRPESPHQLHSLTKLFLSTAVGIAVREGRFSVDDPVIGFFPNEIPATPGENLRAMKVVHLLTGSTGHGEEEMGKMLKRMWSSDRSSLTDDLVTPFMTADVPFAPGTHFCYNPPASTMLSAIVQKVTGETLRDYLRSRLFEPLGISDPVWSTNYGAYVPFGVRTEDLAKMGLLHLQKGLWQGARVLREDWVDAATSLQVPTIDRSEGESQPPSDWNLGYGYQFWRSRHNTYNCNGALGQFCIVIPDLDAVIAVTSQSFDGKDDIPAMQGLLDLVWEHLLPAMPADSLPQSRAAARLQLELAAARLPPPVGSATSVLSAGITGKSFKLEPNKLGADSVSFDFNAGMCEFSMRAGGKATRIRSGFGEWIDGITDMPGTPIIFFYEGDLRPAKIAAATAWTDSHTLEMQWRFYEMPTSLTVRCRFQEDRLTIDYRDSLNRQSTLTGMLVAAQS